MNRGLRSIVSLFARVGQGRWLTKPGGRLVQALNEHSRQTGGDSAGAGPIVDPDAVLVERARGGDRDALGELLTGHESMLFAVCLRTLGDRETARDITQDALVRAIQSLDSFDGRSRFSTWLTRIAINACLSHLRKQRLRKHTSLDAPVGRGAGGGGRGDSSGSSGQGIAQTLPGREPEPGSRIEKEETLECLDRAMARIDPDQRVLLSLRDVRGLDYARIADALGVPVGTVKSRLFRARAALREAMEEVQSEGASERRSPSVSPERGRRAGSGSDPRKDESDRVESDRDRHGSAQDRPDAEPGRSVG